MHRESISNKRLWAWLAVAMSAPLAHFSDGSWLALLIAGLICCSLLALLPARSGIPDNKILSLVELAWIVVLLSQLMPLSAQYWPGEKSKYVIPTALLALGAYACTKRASRVTGVLFWFTVIMAVPILAAGCKDMKLHWLLPRSLDFSLWIITILLLPSCSSFLPVGKKGRGWYPGIVLFSVILWLIASGVLSSTAAAQSETPFRVLSKSLTLGAASRFESMISVFVTLGWFGLAAFLIRCASTLAEAIGVKETVCPWSIAAAAVLLLWTGVQLKGAFCAVFTAILWILIPVLHGWIFSKKSEKSA